MAGAQRRRVHRLADDPQAALDLHEMIANTWLNLGDVTAAEAQARGGADLARRHPELRPELAECLNLLGAALSRQERLDESDAALREALDINRREIGERSAPVATNLANLAVNAGKRDPAAALPLLRDVLERAPALHGESKAVVAESMLNLGVALLDSGGDIEEAHRLVSRRARAAAAVAAGGRPGPGGHAARSVAGRAGTRQWRRGAGGRERGLAVAAPALRGRAPGHGAQRGGAGAAVREGGGVGPRRGAGRAGRCRRSSGWAAGGGARGALRAALAQRP